MTDFRFYSVILLFLVQSSVAYDPIILPFERFLYDLELFIPIMKQEVEFAELEGVTDDQAYEQVKSLFSILQFRLQELRIMGLVANENRLKTGENNDKMCGVGNDFYYYKLDKQLRKLNTELNAAKITAVSNRVMLRAIYDGLVVWRRGSQKPCLTKNQETRIVRRR